MESSEDNPPPSSEAPQTEQPAEAPPAEAQAEGEPVAPQPENQAGDSPAEKPEEAKTEGEPAPVHVEGEEGAGDATVVEGEAPVTAGEAPAEEGAVKHEGEPTPEQVEGHEVGGEPAGEEKTGETLEEPVHEIQPEEDTVPEQTDEEFASDLVNVIVSEAVDHVEQQSFITSIVNKIVAHAVGEESSEESEEEVSEIVPKIEEIPGESITSEILKYLFGPESLRLEEERWRAEEFPPTCISFLNVVEFARIFVDGIIEKAVEVCLLKYKLEVKYRKKQVEVQNIRWPSIENFTVNLGKKKIDEYIQMTFEVEEDWLYKINFIAAQSDLSSDVYLYEVVFCIPTPCYPIAQATVSIYFSCDVSRVKPRECPIDVTYSIESLKEVLVPGRTIVNDDMLLRLIYSKLSVFKSLYF